MKYCLTKSRQGGSAIVRATTKGFRGLFRLFRSLLQRLLRRVLKDRPSSLARISVEIDDAVSQLRAKLQLRIEDDPYGDCAAPILSFDDLKGLPPSVSANMKRQGFTAPMPIQAQALPLVLQGRDVIGIAQTGSGKTLAFLLPAAVHVSEEKRQYSGSSRPTVIKPAPSVLILAPTRELAIQIADEAGKVLHTPDFQVGVASLYGGGDRYWQEQAVRSGCDIVAATPGRLWDFADCGILTLSKVSYFVLDEADRMLDVDFTGDDVTEISKHIKKDRQMLFFAATWNAEVQKLAEALCQGHSKPVRISYGQDVLEDGNDVLSTGAVREGIVQEVVVIDHKDDERWETQYEEKNAIMDKHISRVLHESQEHKVLVFVGTRRLADELSKKLQAQGFDVDCMHGGKSQGYRLWALHEFKQGGLRVLIVTDVLSRGIDIPSVSHIVVHEMGEVEDYIHRIGRTARGRYGTGHALVFFEYWDYCAHNAAQLIEVLEASKQRVPDELRKIANEVAEGKRQRRSWSSWQPTGADVFVGSA